MTQKSTDEFAVAFQFTCEFEDATPKARPLILKAWTLAHPWLGSLFRELARDIIRDELRSLNRPG